MADARKAAEKRVGKTLIRKWTLDRLLDIGGMAAVYAGTHRNGMQAAIKILHPQYAKNEQVRSRFLREGYAANKVNHPGAVSVLDDDIDSDGSVFLVMELLQGESLDQWLRRSGGRLGAAEILAIADQTLDVLAAAHPRGIVHRDIKPGNLFITNQGQVKVLDFGLARVRDAQGSINNTRKGLVLGTTEYMPPEQARGRSKEIDGRTDLFAVGAVMYRCLSGNYIHGGRSPTEKLLNAMQNHVRPVRKVAKNLPDYIAQVVDKALSFDRNNRYLNAREMRGAVRHAYAELGVRAKLMGHERTADTATGGGDEGSMLASLIIDVSFGDMEAEMVGGLSEHHIEPADIFTRPPPPRSSLLPPRRIPPPLPPGLKATTTKK